MKGVTTEFDDLFVLAQTRSLAMVSLGRNPFLVAVDRLDRLTAGKGGSKAGSV